MPMLSTDSFALKWGLWTVLFFVLLTVLFGLFAVSPPVGIAGGVVAVAVAVYVLMDRGRL